MEKDAAKILDDINAAVKKDGCAVASIPPNDAGETACKDPAVDAVTTGTMKNNVYLPPMPVLFPPAPPIKKD